MKDERGNVTIRNFYDDVVPLTRGRSGRRLTTSPTSIERCSRSSACRGPSIPTAGIEAQHNRPTLSVTGIESGGRGTAGARSRDSRIGVAPALEMRLVKGLDRGPSSSIA